MRHEDSLANQAFKKKQKKELMIQVSMKIFSNFEIFPKKKNACKHETCGYKIYFTGLH